jgi:hypothetical protein
MYYISWFNCFEIWRYFFRRKKGRVVAVGTIHKHLISSDTFSSHKGSKHACLTCFMARVFLCLWTAFFESPFPHNSHRSQVLLLGMMSLFQTGQLGWSFCSSVRCFAFQRGDYVGSGPTPTFYQYDLHLEIYLKIWIPIWMWARNLSEHSSSTVSFWLIGLTMLPCEKMRLFFSCPRELYKNICIRIIP